MVHQHFMLSPVMSVTENIVVGHEPAQRLADRREEGASRRFKPLIDQRYHFNINANAKVEDIIRRRAAARRDPQGDSTAAPTC